MASPLTWVRSSDFAIETEVVSLSHNTNTMAHEQTLLLTIWDSSQHNINSALSRLTPQNAHLRLQPTTASAGYLLRHVAEGQLLLLKMMFHLPIPFEPTMSRGEVDTGKEWDAETTRHTLELGAQAGRELIQSMPAEHWLEKVEAAPFGTQTRMAFLCMIMNHSAHHVGQAELAMKRGV